MLLKNIKGPVFMNYTQVTNITICYLQKVLVRKGFATYGAIRVHVVVQVCHVKLKRELSLKMPLEEF